MIKKIAVLRGGVSYDRQKSLEFGMSILEILKKEDWINVNDIILHPNGAFSIDGKLKDLNEILNETDYVWNAIIGHEGESGNIAEIIELNNKKIIGHDSFKSRLTHDKQYLHDIVKQHNIKTPYNKKVKKTDYNTQNILEAFKFVGVPSFVKPVIGSNMHLVDLILHYEDLIKHTEKIIANNNDILIEQYIKGISVSAFVYEMNGVIQVAIYTHNPEDLGKLKKEDVINIRNEALKIHSVLGFDFHVEYDFILNKNGIYLIEANTYPSLKHDYLKDIWSDYNNFSEYVKYILKNKIK